MVFRHRRATRSLATPKSINHIMKSQIAYVLFLVPLILIPTAIKADTLIWDYGPTRGSISDWPEGNAEAGQNFSDSVVFPTATTVTGYNLYSESHHLWPFTGSFCVRFWNDNGGTPGSLIREFDIWNVPSTQFQFLNNFTNSGGWAMDLYKVSLSFDPIVLEANKTYWVGASGLNWDCGTYSIFGAGDGSWAQMSGSSLAWMSNQFGDLMFQLVGEPIPEPSVLAFAGLAAVIWFRRSALPKKWAKR